MSSGTILDFTDDSISMFQKNCCLTVQYIQKNEITAVFFCCSLNIKKELRTESFISIPLLDPQHTHICCTPDICSICGTIDISSDENACNKATMLVYELFAKSFIAIWKRRMGAIILVQLVVDKIAVFLCSECGCMQFPIFMIGHGS